MTTPAHIHHPLNTAWTQRVSILEEEGMSTSDAQGIADLLVLHEDVAAAFEIALIAIKLFPATVMDEMGFDSKEMDRLRENFELQQQA